MMENNYEISGDSAEYEYLTEAVELSANVEGFAVEVGVRRGFGTKTIIDAVHANCPSKVVISIDPYGSIPYIGREHDGYVRLDYDNPMRNETMYLMWNHVMHMKVNWLPFIMTDTMFFKSFPDGIEINDIETSICNKYSMVHLDGPHTVAAIKAELDFFIPRMDIGATIVFDDVTPDFYDHSQIEEYIKSDFEIIRTGGKKQIVRKTTKATLYA